jgi:hypothetical protein
MRGMKIWQNLIAVGRGRNIEEIQKYIGATIGWIKDQQKSSNTPSVKKRDKDMKQRSWLSANDRRK